MARPQVFLLLFILHLATSSIAAAVDSAAEEPALPPAVRTAQPPGAVDDAALAAAAPAAAAAPDHVAVSAALAADLHHQRDEDGSDSTSHGLSADFEEVPAADARTAKRPVSGAQQATLVSRLIEKPAPQGAPHKLGVFAAYAAERARRAKMAADEGAGVERVSVRPELDPAVARQEEAARRAALARDPDRVWRNAPQHLYTGYTYRSPHRWAAQTGAQLDTPPHTQPNTRTSVSADKPSAVPAVQAEPLSARPVAAEPSSQQAKRQPAKQLAQPASANADPVVPAVRPVGAPVSVHVSNTEHEPNTEGEEHLTDEQLRLAREKVALLSSSPSSLTGIHIFAFLVAVVLALLGLIACARRIGGKSRRSIIRKLRAPKERDVEV